MSLTSRKRRPLDRSEGHLRDAKLLVIATEGEKTEAQYFSIFKNLRVNLRVIPTQDSKSSPEYVLERLQRFWDEYDLGEDDELWLMIDVDRWGDAKLSRISQICIQKRYGLAISNPCFELGLYLHFADVEPGAIFEKCKDVETLLRAHLGSYNKAKLSCSDFETKIATAIGTARKLHTNVAERYPTSAGSHVYKIVEQLV